MKMTRNYRTTRRIVIATAITLAILMLTGCFWTPEDAKEGGITLLIDRGDLGASAIEDYDGFFLGYVVSDSLMRGDDAAAEQAFTEVETAFDAFFDQFFTALSDPTASFGDLIVDVSFPAIQLQAQFFTGTSGSNSFRGLRAGNEYLVVMTAGSFTGTGGIGYTLVTIDGGETKTVNLSLGDNYAAFDAFLQSRYGIEPEPAPVTTPTPVEPATIVIAGDGYDLGSFGGPPLYFELLDGNTGIPTTPGPWSSTYPDWYTNVVVNTDGDLVGESGPRDSLSQPLTSQSIAVAPGKSWRVMITTWEERSNKSPGTNNFFYVSKVINPAAGEAVSLQFASLYSGFSLNSSDFYGFGYFYQSSLSTNYISAYGLPGF
ncbi:MAG: hypothetical protein PF508_02145 [Spirochaeta sp.]|nr:hypothetical protein [Spirochaeta sp.]